MKFANKFKVSVLTIAITASPAFAGFSHGNAVTFDKTPVFSIDASAQGFSPETRAHQAQDALDNALFLSHSGSADGVKVERRSGAFVLTYDGNYITTADAACAQAQNLSAENLANSWANSLRTALSDSSRSASYIASLKAPHQLKGDVVTEKKVYAPAGTFLPVAFQEPLSARSLTSGQIVTGRVMSNVAVGNYYIPENSILLGRAIESRPGEFTVHISSIRTPAGNELPFNGVLTDRLAMNEKAPHVVATASMPANSTTKTRIPASIAIGARGTALQALTITTASGYVPTGHRVGVILENTSQVSVLPGAGPM